MRLPSLVAVATLLVALTAGAVAHGGQAGDVVIGHPFATPTVPGAKNGAVYFARLENKGTQADRLLRASTPAAARVELHRMNVDAQGVMRMREIDAIALAPGSTILMRPGQGVHLMLLDLRAPLREGATFPMTLEFERGGKTEVKVVVQQPRPTDAAASHPQGHSHSHSR
jgi:periplasmic copper chaperone A